MKTLITIVRHGETEWNVAMRLQGKQDSPLTAKGKEQVKRVAEALKTRTFDVFISSDLGRALQTAEAINRFQGMTIIPDDGFRERNFGVMEGMTLAQIRAEYPDAHVGYKARNAEYQVPEGESLIQFSKRVNAAFDRIVAEYPGKRVLLVAHGGVLDCLVRRIFGFPLGETRNFSVYNAAINTFSFEDGLWKLEEWGNIDHFNGTGNPRDEI